MTLPVAIDITEAIVLSGFLRLCRFCLSIVVIGSFIAFLAGQGTGWSAVTIGAAGAYVVVRFPRRRLLLGWIWLLILGAAASGAWCLWQLATSIASVAGPGLALLFAGIAFTFHRLWRVLENRNSSEERRRDATGMFGLQRGVLESWFSDGWGPVLVRVAVLIVLFVAVGPTGAEITACALLIAVLNAVVLVRFALFPAKNAAEANAGIRLIRATARKSRGASRQSYFRFLLTHSVRTPKALGWLFCIPVLYAVYLVLTTAIEQALGPENRPESGFVDNYAWVGLVMGMTICWTRARQHAMLRAMRVTDFESEDFILFLRSFMDEQAAVARDGWIYRLLLATPALSGRLVLRFEELIAGVVWPIGKLVALSRPGERLPEPGAVRVRPDTEGDWQGRITRLIGRARYVVMGIGISGGLKWEFQQFETAEQRAKLLLMTVPEQGSVLATWKIFAKQCPELLAFSEEQVDRSLATPFDRDGRPMLIFARQRSAEAYRIALRACLMAPEELREIADGRPAEFPAAQAA